MATRKNEKNLVQSETPLDFRQAHSGKLGSGDRHPGISVLRCFTVSGPFEKLRDGPGVAEA
jgi:hypothetical protein